MMAIAKDRNVSSSEIRRLQNSGYRVAESEPKEKEIEVPAYVPEKFKADWIKSRKQVLEYMKRGPK